MKEKKRTLSSIRNEIQLSHLLLIIIITILFSLGGIAINVNAYDKSLNQNLQNMAELVSHLYSQVEDRSVEELRDYFDEAEKRLSDIDVISIVNLENTRVYHTNHKLIGTKYDGTLPAFENHTQGFYTENETGPSGPQRRAYSAIYGTDGIYRGFIMTITLKKTMHNVIAKIIALFCGITFLAILIEIAISKTISKRIKQRLMGYEPDTFSSMFKIRENILETINDGIIAIDNNKNIQFINTPAKKILKCDNTDQKVELITQQVFAEKYLLDSLINGTVNYGLQESTLDGTELVIDTIPIKQDESIVGAVGILHDRTEYTKLMEDLSGTKYLVDSMRANNHDFTNKLHVILGLIQIGKYDKAVSYIENISIIQRETISAVMHAIDNPSFAALLIGKIARASECNVKFKLKEGSSYKASDMKLPSEALVTICGNLIDNAIDAMNMNDSEQTEVKELLFGVFSRKDAVLITVDDTGVGISKENTKHLFEKGFSTKGKSHGVGLHHVKQLVESLGGNISFESQEGAGTSFMVSWRKNV